MPGTIPSILELILALIPSLLPSDLDKLNKQIQQMQKGIDKKEKEWEHDKEDLIKALQDPIDIPALNRIFARWVEQLYP